ncbi:hypothetical protein BDP27DRAFT_1198699, partial [Rhodocollybia butyracea]
WLYGPAGAGKSAIAQTFAEACAKKGILAGSFFFWRSDPSRNNPERLFNTLAHQIAGAMPELRPIINSVVIRNPSVLTSSIEIQFNDLILQPCSLLSWMRTQIIIIDGLDECSKSRNQQR